MTESLICFYVLILERKGEKEEKTHRFVVPLIHAFLG